MTMAGLYRYDEIHSSSLYTNAGVHIHGVNVATLLTESPNSCIIIGRIDTTRSTRRLACYAHNTLTLSRSIDRQYTPSPVHTPHTTTVRTYNHSMCARTNQHNCHVLSMS